MCLFYGQMSTWVWTSVVIRENSREDAIWDNLEAWVRIWKMEIEKGPGIIGRRCKGQRL